MARFSSEREPLLLEKKEEVDVGSARSRLWRLSRTVRWTWSVGLLFASVANVLVGAQVGKVMGNFYEAFGRRDGSLFRSAMMQAGFWYALSVLFSVLRDFLAEFIALRARISLTGLLQTKYCQNRNYYWMDKERIDNPDQRIASDASSWSNKFSEVLKVGIASPFTILYYTYLVQLYAGYLSVVMVYVFFLIGLLVQRVVVVPTSRVVFNQERMEGDFRARHLHLSDAAESIAVYDGGKVEHKAISESFAHVVSNQRSLMYWHLLLGTSTKVLEYAGAALNYVCVAIPVFGGNFGGMDTAEVAKFVSNASFANLSLIYSFTELLDLGKQFSTLIGLTERVGELLDHFDVHLMDNEEAKAIKKESELHVNQQVHTKTEPRSGCLLTPTIIGDRMEASIHACPTLEDFNVRNVFPDAPNDNILLVLTNQEAGLDLAPALHFKNQSSVCSDQDWGTCVSTEMDRLLGRFLLWARWICKHLQDHGHWADAVDPRSGLALGLAGSRVEVNTARYDEVAAAHILLGYPVKYQGAAAVISHPRWSTCCYPASMVTSAPFEVVRNALRMAAETMSTIKIEVSSLDNSETGTVWATGDGSPLLVLKRVSYRTPSGNPAIHDLCKITIREHGSLLIMGESGCGKSTLVKVLAGLWPLSGGSVDGITLPPERSGGELRGPEAASKRIAMIFPQNLYLGPGSTLRSILSYPSENMKGRGDDTIIHVIQDVGLSTVLNRVQGNLDAEIAWEQVLSPGQKQKILMARVLLQQPKLVVLDECTSALPEADEDRLYTMLQNEGIARVSIGHRQALKSFHELVLQLHGNGNWDIDYANSSEE